MADASASEDHDALAKLTRISDLCARAGNAQMVTALHLAMFEIERLRQELAVARQRYRLVEQMVDQRLPR
jgi:hypothetical protein